jgi:cytochrome b561
MMHPLSTRFRYGTVAQVFHWLTAILVIAAYIMGPGGSERHVYSPALDFTRQTHETLGISVFAIVLLRLLWRLLDSAPEDPPMQPWMRYSAKLAYIVLYGLLIAIPVTAIAGAWLEGHPLTLLGLRNINPMLAQAHDVGQTVSALHTTLANVILWVAGVHAAAALYHHFFLRDTVLLSMLPGRWRSPALGASAQDPVRHPQQSVGLPDC